MESFWARFVVGNSRALLELGVVGKIFEAANSNADRVGLLGLEAREGLWLMATECDTVMRGLILQTNVCLLL